MPTAYDRALDRAVPGVIEETVCITKIPAPTFREQTRARFVHDRLAAIGGGLCQNSGCARRVASSV